MMDKEKDSLRSIQCEMGFLSRSDGSALCTQGNTVSLASVYGPCEVKPQRLLIDQAYVEVIYKPRAGLPNVGDKGKEAFLRNICQIAILTTQHPRTSISIAMQEVHDDGGLLATSVNTACLALMDAGIPLKFLVAGISSAVSTLGEVTLDPDARALADSKASFTIVVDSIKQDVMAIKTSGSFTTEQFNEVLTKSKAASSHIFQFYRDIVKKYADKISLT